MELRALIVFFVSLGLTENQSLHNFVDDEQRISHGDVIYASILFRHGDRTPNYIIPTDPYELSYWEEGLGQLTKFGKLHAYELGKWIRQEYKDLISDQPYRYDLITVNSTNVDRTIMSAELVLAGMYPPSDEEMWNSENLRWQPIPVHSNPTPPKKALGFRDGFCERYDLEKSSLNRDPKFIAFYEKHQDLFEYVSFHSGVEMPKDDVCTAVNNLWDVYDTLSVEARNNRTLQNWTREVFPEPMKSVGELRFSTLAYTDEMKRLMGGPLLETIVNDMIKKATDSTENRKFHLYSAHETTLAPFLDTLGVFNRQVPPLTAAVIVELRKKDEEYFVRVLYRNSSLVAPYLLEVPGCESNFCTLDEFIRVTASLIPEDWESECEVGFLTKLFSNFTINGFVVIGIVVLLLVALITIVGVLYFRTRYKHYETIQDCNVGPNSK